MFSKNVIKIKQEQIEEYWYTFCQNHWCWTNNWLFSVHHIVYKSEAPKHPRLNDMRNLLICCDKCHKWFHNKKSNRNKIVIERNLEALFHKSLIINEK